MNENETLMQMCEAAAICEGLRLLIDKLQRSENYVHDASYTALLAFFSNLHWRYHKIQTSRQVEFDVFGRLHIKTDGKQMNFN